MAEKGKRINYVIHLTAHIYGASDILSLLPPLGLDLVDHIARGRRPFRLQFRGLSGRCTLQPGTSRRRVSLNAQHPPIGSGVAHLEDYVELYGKSYLCVLLISKSGYSGLGRWRWTPSQNCLTFLSMLPQSTKRVFRLGLAPKREGTSLLPARQMLGPSMFRSLACSGGIIWPNRPVCPSGGRSRGIRVS